MQMNIHRNPWQKADVTRSPKHDKEKLGQQSKCIFRSPLRLQSERHVPPKSRETRFKMAAEKEQVGCLLYFKRFNNALDQAVNSRFLGGNNWYSVCCLY